MAATGRSPPTAGSSPSATPASTAPRAVSTSTPRSSAWRPPRTAAATGRWPPTAGSSPSATPPSTAPRAATPHEPDRRHGGRPDGGGYWEVASDGGIFAFGDAGFHGSRAAATSTTPIVGMASDADGRRLLGGRLRRRDLRLRRRRLRGLRGRSAPGRPDRGHGGRSEAAATGRSPLTVGSSPSATPRSWASTGSQPQPADRRDGVAGSGCRLSEVASDGGIFSLGDAPFHGSVPELPPPGPPRIALYGDSLASEAGQDFAFLATDAGASVRVRTFPGAATCDFLSPIAADAEEWQPTAAVLAFSGDNFTPCMAGEKLGTPQYFAKYESDTQAAISIFRSVGTKVILVGLPLTTSTSLSENVSALNQIFDRWRPATSASRTTMRASPSWQTGSSPGPSPASPASRARDQPGRTSCALLMVCTSAPTARPHSSPASKVRRLLVRRLPFCRRPCSPPPSLRHLCLRTATPFPDALAERPRPTSTGVESPSRAASSGSRTPPASPGRRRPAPGSPGRSRRG